MKIYKLREFSRLLNDNGYFLNRQTGDHLIFKNLEGKHISVPFSMNPCITTRLIKTYNLKNGKRIC